MMIFIKAFLHSVIYVLSVCSFKTLKFQIIDISPLEEYD